MIYSGHLVLSGFRNKLSCTKQGTHIEFWWGGKGTAATYLTSKDGRITELTVRNKGGWTWFRIV